ncbi:MAG: TonB-dependent receptor [Methylococcaceae bacterium]|nr:TonB-dependent receptor [Methylococcaceae bacterium]
MQKFFFHSLVLAGVSTSLTAQVASNNAPASLAETVVTATRSETARDELATAASVFTRTDIERLQVKTLPELLINSPGIDLVERGGYGKNTDLFMRGTNANHVLVLIDGIKAGSVTDGRSALQFIPIDQIERVEIIRGPQSSLYGSEAIGGVIQIFTRKGAQMDKPNVSLEAGAGAFDTFKTAGTVSGKWQNSWYSLSASHLNSQGINARRPTTSVNEPDRDGYYNTGLNARAGHHFDNNAEIEAFFMRTDGKTEFDGTPNKTEFVNQMVGTSASLDVLNNWRSTLRFGQTQDENDNFRPSGLLNSRFNTTRWNASWLNQISLTQDHRVTLGTDYRLDEVQSTTRFKESSRYDVGVFGELHSRLFDKHFTNASLRWDENEAFGESVTGNFGWRYNWQYGLSAFASFGNAFNSPTFNQLYTPAPSSAGYGNPNLRPEQSTSFEAGLAGQHEWLNWEVRAYHTDIDNLIVFVPNAPAQNINKAQIDGMEAEIASQIFGWHNKLNLGLLSPRDRISNLNLIRRAEQSLSYDLSHSFETFDVGAHVSAQGSRFEDRANTKQLAGFVTVDLRTAYHINKQWVLSAKLNNLLDKQYETADTYNNFGRNFFFTIHYNN